jgi:hypothetical protein
MASTAVCTLRIQRSTPLKGCYQTKIKFLFLYILSSLLFFSSLLSLRSLNNDILLGLGLYILY